MDAGDLHIGAELRQAEEAGRDQLGEGGFHELRPFPKNPVAPHEDLACTCVTGGRRQGAGPAQPLGDSDRAL